MKPRKGNRLSDFFNGPDGPPSTIKRKTPRRTERPVIFDPDVHGNDGESSGDDERAFVSSISFSPIKPIATPRIGVETRGLTATPKRDYEVVVDYDSDGTGFAFSPVKFTPAAIKRRVKTPAPAATRGHDYWDSVQRRVVSRPSSVKASNQSIQIDHSSPQAAASPTQASPSQDSASSDASSPEPSRKAIYARPRQAPVTRTGKRKTGRLLSITQFAHIHLTRSVSGQRPLQTLETLPVPLVCLPEPPRPKTRRVRPPIKIPPTQPRSPKFALDALKESRARAAEEASRQQSLQALAAAANSYATHVLDDLSPPRFISTPLQKQGNKRRRTDDTEDDVGDHAKRIKTSSVRRNLASPGEGVPRMPAVLPRVKQPLSRARRPTRLMQPIASMSPVRAKAGPGIDDPIEVSGARTGICKETNKMAQENTSLLERVDAKIQKDEQAIENERRLQERQALRDAGLAAVLNWASARK